MYAINFYSPLYADQLAKGRKSATIRLGDHSRKYLEGQLVWVTVGLKYGPRQKIFTGIIDSVEVKTLKDLTRRDIQNENPELRRAEEVADLLYRIYDQPVGLDDVVTVIQFSRVFE